VPASWPDNFPFITDNSPVMSTPAGDIPYETQGLRLSERYARHEGGTSRIPLCINGEDAADFLLYGPGYTVRAGSSGTGVYLQRYLPYKNPSTETQYLVELTTAQNGAVDVDPTLDNWPIFSWLVYNADFSTLPFDVKSESEMPVLSDGTPNELARYVIRRPAFTSRERKIPQFQLETDESTPNPIPESGWIPDVTSDWLYTWVEVPWDAIPFDSIADTLGKINNATFDTVTPRGRNMAQGTVLLAGVQGLDQPYIGPDGGMYGDITYLLRQRKLGWNNYVRLDDGGALTTVAWRYRGKPGVRPYKETDFQVLFKPV
jgi:hypothetical protein